MARALVDIVEAAYDPAQSDQAWVEHVLSQAHPVLDEGFGMSVFTFDCSDHRVKVGSIASRGLPAGFDAANTAEAAPPEFIDVLFTPTPPVVLLTECIAPNPGAEALFESSHVSFGIGDVVAVRATDPSLRGCVLTVVRAESRPLPPRRRAQLAKLAAHIASGWRLRLAHGPSAGRLDGADAVFDHRGKLEHLAGALDEKSDGRKLSAAVERLRAAQQARRLDPDAALELWRALVDGRWSIVATTDTDGRRFLLARRNAPDVRDIKALTREETLAAAYAALGHSGKLISYELGLSPSSVSALLKGAMRKLGVKSVAELALLFGR